MTEVGLAVGAMTMAEGIVMSTRLHRAGTHGSVELHPGVSTAAEIVNWGLSGMSPLEFAAVHLTHHAFTDTELTPEHWNTVQKNYPGAPREAFRDPHSPIIEGHLNILLKNGITHYPKAAKAIVSYVRQLDADNVPRELWPPHLMRINLEQSRFERTLERIPHARKFGLVATGAALAATRGPKRAALTMGAYVPSILLLGGGVNAFGHTGQVDSEIERLKVIMGQQAAIPDKDGSYASNFFKWMEFFTAGEAAHGDHHRNPGNAHAFYDTAEEPPAKPDESAVAQVLDTFPRG